MYSGAISALDYYGPSFTIYNAVKLYQNRSGDSWVNDILFGSTKTIGAVGCALTSFTMMLQTNGYSSHNPGQVNSHFASNNTYANTFSSSWKSLYGISNCDEYFTAYSAQSSNIFTTEQIQEFMATDMYYLNKPFVVGLKRLSNDSPHFVLAWGCSVNGGEISIQILDPWYPRDYYSLDQYYSAGWVMTSARLFR